MAKYRFKCTPCDKTYTKYANPNQKITCDTCGLELGRLPPSVSKANLTELIDPYSGVHLSPDHKDEINQRSLDHFWSVEVKRLCAEYSPDECIHQGWAFLDEQGKFCVHDKPPNRR